MFMVDIPDADWIRNAEIYGDPFHNNYSDDEEDYDYDFDYCSDEDVEEY